MDGKISIKPASASRCSKAFIHLKCPDTSGSDDGCALDWKLTITSQHVKRTSSTANGETGMVIKCENKALSKTKCVSLDYFDCTGHKVTGAWVKQQQTMTPMTYEYEEGHVHSQTHTGQETWSESVTQSAEAGIEVGGIGMSQSMSLSQLCELAMTDQTHWSTSITTTWGRTCGDDQVGKVAHQWICTTIDPWGETTKTWTPNVALTNPGSSTPECIPHCIAPGSTLTSQSCCVGGCLPSYDQDDVSCNVDCSGLSIERLAAAADDGAAMVGSELVALPSSDGGSGRRHNLRGRGQYDESIRIDGRAKISYEGKSK